MSSGTLPVLLLSSSTLLLLATSPAFGQKPLAPTPSASSKTVAPEARIPDVVLTDQHGKSHRFFTDLVKGKLVLMNAVFTTCNGTCPIQTRVFKQAQPMLKERFGDDVMMLSVTLDPKTDTPQRLQAFAKRHGAGPGWLFLTGEREDVVAVLKAMDIYAANPQEHTPICVVGNERSGVWTKMINLTSPQDLVGRVEFVASDQAQRR